MGRSSFLQDLMQSSITPVAGEHCAQEQFATGKDFTAVGPYPEFHNSRGRRVVCLCICDQTTMQI